jgi:hypothetical protein
VWPRCNVGRTDLGDALTGGDIDTPEEREAGRSERPCPVCGVHALALDVPPRIDVMGFQPYSDIIGMGDRPQQGELGIVCRSCGTYWRDLAAFERGEPEPEVSDDEGVRDPS